MKNLIDYVLAFAGVGYLSCVVTALVVRYQQRRFVPLTRLARVPRNAVTTPPRNRPNERMLRPGRLIVGHQVPLGITGIIHADRGGIYGMTRRGMMSLEEVRKVLDQ